MYTGSLETWLNARKNKQTIQGAVLCTFADVYYPFYNEGMVQRTKPDGKVYLEQQTSTIFARIFSFQHETTPFTVIEDAWEEELEMIKDLSYNVWGLKGMPLFKDVQYTDESGRKSKKNMYFNEYLKYHFFDTKALHVGRLTDADIELIAGSKGVYSGTWEARLSHCPYVVYRPERYRWSFPIVNGTSINEDIDEPSEPIPGRSEREQKRTNTLLLGLAASAALAMIN